MKQQYLSMAVPGRLCASEQRIDRDNLILQPLHARQSLEIEWSCGKDKALQRSNTNWGLFRSILSACHSDQRVALFLS